MSKAIEECKILWKYLAITGMADKERAISNLYFAEKLSQESYLLECPLCHYYIRREDLTRFGLYTKIPVCDKCPWPGTKTFNCRCARIQDSPYIDWQNATKRSDMRRFASEVYQKIIKKLTED